jgi:predicted cation transporter
VDFVVVADLVILLLVLILPLISHRVEQNLEAFLFLMGLLAALAAGVLNWHLIREALADPIPITVAVLVAGLLFKWGRRFIGHGLVRLRTVLPMPVLVGLIVAVLGLISSVITAIIASLVLVELISAMRFRVEDESRLVVVACMAIGLGAALTPIGEPLSTIAVSKLDQDFWYLVRLLGPWIVPGIILLAVWSGFRPLAYKGETLTEEESQETYRGVVIRAAKVFLFVMALVLLGEGFRPIIDRFVIGLDARLLYWINMVSAVLDNATLTAAEISPRMHQDQIRAVLMGLLISGGMLIPGNIPNIIAAGKLKIRSRTWARHGVPLGLVLLVAYFAILFFL